MGVGCWVNGFMEYVFYGRHMSDHYGWKMSYISFQGCLGVVLFGVFKGDTSIRTKLKFVFLHHFPDEFHDEWNEQLSALLSEARQKKKLI
jgi:hypothetical protein